MPTLTTVAHSCGHTGTRDLTALKPFDRTGRVKFLESIPCDDCDPKAEAKKAKRLSGLRAKETMEAEAIETRFGLQPLDGHPKILDWAIRIRARLVQDAFDELGLDEDEFSAAIADPASEINSAGWWLDHRETELTDLVSVFAEALAEEDVVPAGNENPF